jgi:ubiquinone/menaquinone biosynthesis C-methylase UbiE
MQHEQANEMLTAPDFWNSQIRVWADLGCGTGTFTLALANHLSAGSRIMAVDKDQDVLKKIPDNFSRVHIEKRVANFINDSLSLKNLDGILMANSLHYVQNKDAFITKFKETLTMGGAFLIVEYDTDISNPWIPYPINFEQLKKLFKNVGFSCVKKITEKPSRFNRSNLYSAFIQ